MSFIEWYNSTHEDKWEADYADLSTLISQETYDYERYCKEKGIKPVWNG